MTEETPYYPCPVCHSMDTHLALEAKDYTVSGEIFSIRECKKCNVRFTCPVPDEQHIGKYYHSEIYISHSDTSKGLVNKLYHVIRKISLKQKKNWIEQE
ncbi:MAG: class I SAM-dependent methyltransferase, partial [Chitinophagaceae bacterium]